MAQKYEPKPEKINDKPAERDTGLVWGKNPVTEVLRSGSGADTLLLADSLDARAAGYYTALARAAGAVVKRMPAGKLQKLCGTAEHQGVALRTTGIQYAELEDLLALAASRGEPPFLVLCDGIEDPHNLGAVIRSALLCGVHGIIIPKRGGAQVTSTVLKASAGAAERLPVARVVNIAETVRCLKEEGVFVYCADMDGVSLRKNNLTGPIALVLGSEGSGVSQLVKKRCDGVLRLEMAAPGTGVDSFNVSVAAGIILYEIQAQRAGNL